MKKDHKLLEEAYKKILEQQTKNIPSEKLDNVYAIFIHTNTLPIFEEIIKKRKLSKLGVKLFKADFKKDLACITIPNHFDPKGIAEVLWNEYTKFDHGYGMFWGQFSIGYKGKTWSEYSYWSNVDQDVRDKWETAVDKL
jgi:hypothetical protein